MQALAGEGVLTAFGRKLADAQNECVFVSSDPAAAFKALTEKARTAQNAWTTEGSESPCETVAESSRAAFARAELFLSIIVIIWRIRPTLRSSPRIHDFGREKHIIARPAQPWTVASQASGDPIDVRNVGPAEAKNVRCAGLSLLVRPLSDRRRFSVE